MSQEQPRRPPQEEPIKYGDVFNVSGELANQPITPRDAADMQAAETKVLGETVKGGPAAVMQSTAAVNEKRGLVGRSEGHGIFVSDTQYSDHRIITESVGGEVVGLYVRPNLASSPAPAKLGDGAVTIGEALEAVGISKVVGLYVRPNLASSPAPAKLGDGAVTIGEALEAVAQSAGDKLVDQGDVAAIQAAEVRATGRMQAVPGGVAARAQTAALHNARTKPLEHKTKLGDVLADATKLLPEDKPVTRVDAEAVIAAEIRNKPNLATHPGGVASTIDAAARLNQEKK